MKKTLKTILNSLLKTIKIWIPFLFLSIAGPFFINDLLLYFKEIIAFGLLTLIFSFLTLYFSKKQICKKLLLLFFFSLSFLVFVKLTFYCYYRVQINSSAFYVIFETNTTEIKSFLKAYFNKKNLLILVLISLTFFVLIIKQNGLLKNNLKYKKLYLIASLLIFVLILTKFSDENLLIKSLSIFKEYKDTKLLTMSTLGVKDTKLFNNVNSIEEKQTHVCVIGESTSRTHMQIYGYNKSTTPLLNEIRKDLVVFKDCISPNTHTILSLDKILTLSNHKEPNKQNNASIIQLANKSGFNTYWISNQQPIGIYDTQSTVIGSASHETHFVTKPNEYDEVLLPILKQILSKPDKKKVIFIHLMGTHLDYKDRYPEKFNVFSEGNPNSPYNKDKNVSKIIDEYDNAILYNDYIVRSIIEQLKKHNSISFVNYFSDHGDDVYDTIDSYGHNEYHGTKPMYKVPFIIWFSDKYKKSVLYSENIKQFTHRKYNLEDYIDTFASLSGINFNLLDLSKSIIDSSFKEKPRIIKNNINYDKN